MNNDFVTKLERLVSLNAAKRFEALAEKLNQEQGAAIALAGAQGLVHSSGTFTVVLDIACKRSDGLVRSGYSSFKEVYESAGLLTPEGVRARGKVFAENFRDDHIKRHLGDFHATRQVYQAAEVDGMVSHEIGKLKARFLRDVEIDAGNLEVKGALRAAVVSPPETHGIQYDVFLSFATPDSEPAGSVYELLRAKGLDVFFSQKDLQAGDPWEDRIRTALVGSHELCLIVSKESIKREWVLTEWGAAWATQKRITPVLVDCDVDLLQPRLRSKQCIRIEKVESYAVEAATRGADRKR